jgi:hypothetical protein
MNTTAFAKAYGGPPKLHAKADDSMNTKNTPLGTHRELRVIVGIVWQRRS